jgi:CheY-like chemotaxis protein
VGGGHQFVFGMLLPEKPYVKIVVEDSGTGIEAEFLPRMFDPFISTKETTMRTGFGLAVVRSVVMASEGALCVRSVPGKGTTFEVYIALAPAPHASHATEEASDVASEMSLSPVLIVDDDVDAADGLAMALTGLGHRVRAIYDPRVALDEVTRHPGAWPVMVIDVSMPGMNGDELAAHIRKLRPLTRLFLYSGRTSDALRLAASRIGVEAVLQKPIDPRALATLIDRRS